ncbi:MAG: Npt1/Npt2 family nucleotide transporter [Vicinamibacterales bacterium]|nr:Npt1/Npt2 family nucleotide transporter [Vicinamibacterales bacterium]
MTRTSLRRLFDIRSGEAGPALLIALYLATVVAAFLLAKPISKGLFLAEHGAFPLVYVYASVPVAVTLLVPLHARLASGRRRRAAHIATLAFFIVTFVGFWYAFTFRPFTLLPALFYVWVNCYGVVAPVQVWTLAGAVFDTRQARRLFGFIAGGASLGAIVGGLLAWTLVGVVRTVPLILVMVALMVLAVGLVHLTRRVIPSEPPVVAHTAGTSVRASLGAVRRDTYLGRIALLVFLVAIATQWTDFQVNLMADRTLSGNADDLTRFFGLFNLTLGVVAFLLQFATGPTLRRFGVGLGILCLPLAIGAGSVLILLYPTLASVLVTKGLDRSLRFSLDKASYELLYVPIDARVRSTVKATIDVIVSRSADLADAIVLGLVTRGFLAAGAGFELRGTAAINLVVIGAWLMVAAALRRGYVGAVEDRIRGHRLDTEQVDGLPQDRTTTELVTARLHAKDPRDVTYALDLIAVRALAGDRAHPSVRFLLEHPAPDIRSKVLAVLRADEDATALALVEPLLGDADLEVRTEALLFVARHGQIDPLTRIEELGDFHDFSVRAGIIAFLARPSTAQNMDAARTLLDAMVGEGGDARRRTRVEEARLIGVLPNQFGPQLSRLLGDEDPGVVRAALRALGRLGTRQSVDLVLDRLGDARFTGHASTVLVGWGQLVIDTLRDRLVSSRTPPAIRQHIPGVLCQIGGAAALRALVGGLMSPSPALRHEVVVALNKLCDQHPDVAIDTQVVEMTLAAEVMGHYRSYQVLVALEGSADGAAGKDVALSGLQRAMDAERERIFRLLSLLFPDHDLHSAHDGVRSLNPVVRANAVEFLDNVLEPPQLRQRVLPLVDDQVTAAQRAAAAGAVAGTTVTTPAEAVQTLLGSEDSWMRACGLFAVGTLELRELEPELDRALVGADQAERDAARVAKTHLAPTVVEPELGTAEAERWMSGAAGV